MEQKDSTAGKTERERSPGEGCETKEVSIEIAMWVVKLSIPNR